MRVLVEASQSKYGIAIVQNSIDGGVYLLTPCCNDIFYQNDMCLRCRKSYRWIGLATGVSLTDSVEPTLTGIAYMEAWASGIVGNPVEVTVNGRKS